jgi:hypothetical protein
LRRRNSRRITISAARNPRIVPNVIPKIALELRPESPLLVAPPTGTISVEDAVLDSERVQEAVELSVAVAVEVKKVDESVVNDSVLVEETVEDDLVEVDLVEVEVLVAEEVLDEVVSARSFCGSEPKTLTESIQAFSFPSNMATGSLSLPPTKTIFPLLSWATV